MLVIQSYTILLSGRMELSSVQVDMAQEYKSKYKGQQDFGVYKDEAGFGTQTLFEITKQEMDHPMHRNIVAIICRSKANGFIKASGVLISRNLVLTCAHVLYYKAKGGSTAKARSSQIQIYHAPCGLLQKPYQVQKYYLPPKYDSIEKQNTINYDFALLKLAQEVESDQFICLRPSQKLEQCNLKVGIFGYPIGAYSKQQGHEAESVTQRGLTKDNAVLAIRKSKDEIIHDVTTFAGHSGSPIFAHHLGQTVLIGIHKGATCTSINNELIQANSGKYLSHYLVQQLKKSAEELGAQPFRIYQNKQNKVDPPPTLQPTQIVLSAQAEQLLKMANVYFEKNSFEKAIHFYQRSIEECAYPQSWLKLGLSQFALKQMESSVASYREAIKLRPDYAEAYYHLGDSLRKSSRLDQARTNYQFALKYRHDYYQAYNNLALVYYQQQQYRQAVLNYQQAIRINPSNPSYYNNLANALDQDQQPERAIPFYRKAIQLDPNYYLAYDNLAQVLQRLKRADQVSQCYRKAMKISGREAEATRSLGLALARLKRKEQALQELRSYLKLEPQDGQILRLVQKWR